MVEVARSLRAEIEAYSDEAERARRMPDGLTGLLRSHGFIGMSRAPDLGGAGASLVTTMRAVEEISFADASAGWCAAIGSGSIGEPPVAKEALHEVFGPGVYVAGVGAPNGRAVPVEGGYRLSGRWAYASGCHNASWIFAGLMVLDGDRPRIRPEGGPDIRVALLPMSDVTILDTWHVSGLRGTGSHDVTVEEVFVPEARTAAILLMGAPRGDGEYRIPMFTLFGLALAPVALGAARRAIHELIEMAQGKTPLLSGTKLREKPVVQHEIARAEGLVQAARAYVYETTAALEDAAAHRQDIDVAMRARVRLALTHGTEAAAAAVDIAYRLGGGTSIYEASALQRCFRDVHAVTQHFVVAASNYETVGRVLMGLDPGTPTL